MKKKLGAISQPARNKLPVVGASTDTSISQPAREKKSGERAKMHAGGISKRELPWMWRVKERSSQGKGQEQTDTKTTK